MSKMSLHNAIGTLIMFVNDNADCVKYLDEDLRPVYRAVLTVLPELEALERKKNEATNKDKT